MCKANAIRLQHMPSINYNFYRKNMITNSQQRGQKAATHLSPNFSPILAIRVTATAKDIG